MKKILFLIALFSVQYSFAQVSLSNIRLTNPSASLNANLLLPSSVTPQIKTPVVIPQNTDPIYKGQSYSKELEKKAKNGDSAAQTELGLCYLYGNGIGVDDKKAQKWFEKAIDQNNADAMFWMGYMIESSRVIKVKYNSEDLYKKAASLEQPDALYTLYRRNNDAVTLKYAAEQGSVKAQYELGAFYLSQYISSSMSDNSQLDKAKSWFAKAAEQDHPNAKNVLGEITEMEQAIARAKQEAEEKARQEAIAAARRDSLARIEAERQRVQDSIDYATGRKLKPYRLLVSDCNLLVVPATEYYQMNYLYQSDFYKKLKAVISNDVFAYVGKNGLDELDREVYKRSTQYQDDLAELKKKRNEKYALVLNIWNSASNVAFSADGLTFSEWGSSFLREHGINNFFIDFSDILFPIQNARIDNYKLKLRSSDLNLLQKIKSQNQNLSVLFIFTPSSSVEYERNKLYYLTSPLGVYLVDNKTGETLADFSNAARKSTFQADKQRILTGVKNYNARIKANAPKYHNTPKEIMCGVCGGKGYITGVNLDGVLGRTRSRCTACYGRGYTMEHYY